MAQTAARVLSAFPDLMPSPADALSSSRPLATFLRWRNTHKKTIGVASLLGVRVPFDSISKTTETSLGSTGQEARHKEEEQNEGWTVGHGRWWSVVRDLPAVTAVQYSIWGASRKNHSERLYLARSVLHVACHFGITSLDTRIRYTFCRNTGNRSHSPSFSVQRQDIEINTRGEKRRGLTPPGLVRATRSSSS